VPLNGAGARKGTVRQDRVGELRRRREARGNCLASARPTAPPAGAAKLRVHDARLRGFLLEVRASGGATFRFRYTDRRRRRRELPLGRLGEGLSNARVNRHLAVLRSMFNLALKWGLYQGANPASHPGMLREEPRERYLTEAQVQALMAALGTDPDPLAGRAIALCWR
jgi:integrase